MNSARNLVALFRWQEKAYQDPDIRALVLVRDDVAGAEFLSALRRDKISVVTYPQEPVSEQMLAVDQFQAGARVLASYWRSPETDYSTVRLLVLIGKVTPKLAGEYEGRLIPPYTVITHLDGETTVRRESPPALASEPNGTDANRI